MASDVTIRFDQRPRQALWTRDRETDHWVTTDSEALAPDNEPGLVGLHAIETNGANLRDPWIVLDTSSGLTIMRLDP